MAQQTFKADVVITQSAFYNNEYYILQIISYYIMCGPDGPFILAAPGGFVGPSAPTLCAFGPFSMVFDLSSWRVSRIQSILEFGMAWGEMMMNNILYEHL